MGFSEMRRALCRRALVGAGCGVAGLVLILAGMRWNRSAAAGPVPPVLRFHVIAHSDGPADQAVKIQVRDAVLPLVTEVSQGAPDLPWLLARLRPRLPRIQAAAEQAVRAAGSSHRVRVELGEHPFPARTYGDLRLPAGRYAALRVIIGAGAGRNWWCLLFPDLCFAGWTGHVAAREAAAGSTPGGGAGAHDPGGEAGPPLLLDERAASELRVVADLAILRWVRRTSDPPAAVRHLGALPAYHVGEREGSPVPRASDLRKDVIDIRTGRRLGELADVELDEETGKIKALVVPGPARMWGILGNEKDLVIPWHQIVRVGPDCILVDLGGEDERGPTRTQSKDK